MTASQEKEILRRFGAEKVESYCLVNNYGHVFEVGGVRYDARYWANCYGVALNRWKVEPSFPILEKALNDAEG